MATPLTDQDRTGLARLLPDWEIDLDTMRRTFTFEDFAAAMGFVTTVALVAERLDHHPDIDIRWNRVTLVLTTHSLGTLSDLGVALAQAASAAAR